MTKWHTTILIAMLVAGCTRPHPDAPGPVPVPTPTPSPPHSHPPIGEELLAKPPSGWKESYANKAPGMRMAQYVPSGEDTHDWQNMVSFESFTGNPLPQPLELLESVAKDQRAVCDNFESHPTYTGKENGYPTAVALFVCDRSKLTSKGELTLLKMIRGDDNFYVVTRSRRVAPIEPDDVWPIPKQVMAEWSLYLRGIGVCNGADDAHPCPGKGSGQGVGDVSDP